MKSIRNISIFVLVIVVLALLKWKFFPTESAAPPTAASGKLPPAPITAMVLKTQTLSNQIQSSGTIMANEEVQLQTETAGKILKIYFKEGRAVRKGEVLVKINDAELLAQQKRLSLQIQLAEQTETRQRKLVAIGGISQAEYDQALNQLNALKADAELVQAQLAKTTLTAPFDGIIGLKSISEGSYVTTATPVATIQQINPLKIDFSIPEQYAPQVHIGSTLQFTVQGSAQTYTGSLFAIEPKIEPATRSLKLRAVCPNAATTLYPGSFAKIELNLDEQPNTLLIPTEALIPELKGQKVFVYKSGKAVPQKVETGIRNDSTIQITKGLQAGDTIITTGIMQLKPNAAVRIQTIR